MTEQPPDLSELCVIFDLDGTLVDSGPDLTAAMNAVLAEEGLPELAEATVRHLVGDGARALLRRGYAADGQAFPDGAAGDALVERFIEHYRARLTDRTRPFPGAEACLDRLAGAGAALAVCTNKPHDLAVGVLEGLGLMGRFAEVLGRDSLPACKPDPAPLLEILRRTGRARGVMIGDTMTDVAAARAAGMPVMLATFGYGGGGYGGGGYGTGGGRPEIALQTHEQRFEDFEALFGLVVAASPA